MSCFPVTYSDNFYRDMIIRGKENENLCKFAYYHGYVIGAICVRIEPIIIPTASATDASTETIPALESSKSTSIASNSSKKRLYIMTLGVLAAYRGYGVGEQLVQSVLDYYQQARDRSFNSHDIQDLAQVEEITLHVHTLNEGAIRFYVEKFGFERGELIKNYYTQRIEPPDCYVLHKKL